ncbi:biosynthetic-type acetolactate synthase large subunit [Oceanobacillus alkalisoli]|uniref:biosynthetic-type acetolactate synthase large subunit n=1 Tax=Oceanobacillus alkalisoli TaxID=2925113 RepID=UPI001EF0840B|nr:biosynthetic-type acetolactate synthase large subunit [Oceanobacillus alkalisoli]MCF3944419.1 biosynthetic-type acetolactate synthase large subunit [Oceanobacillus alkalisoli]MCG5102120.1 biosynthetic-type acetolactate synthase large subunit [Oceanobacillus alkalisoli]
MAVEARQKTEAGKGFVTGADLLIEALVEAKVEKVFGYPGGAVLPIYDAMFRHEFPFEHILCRHEQGSIHAAEGYARVTGKPGVVIATSGPGATNLITGITDAMMDSLPLVIITGQVGQGVIGTDAFQEADVLGLTTPITKYNYQVQDAKELSRVVNEAFYIATTGRPGPVLIDIPKNISAELTVQSESNTIELPGYQPNVKPNALQLQKLANLLEQAERPVLLAGAGVLLSDGTKYLREFVERYEIPVVNTLLGLGNFPGTHELFLGMGGMHGTYTANMAIYEADVLINIGARFDDRLTGKVANFAPGAKVAHIDIDPAEIGKIIRTDVPIVADAKTALQALLAMDIKKPETTEWIAKQKENKENYPYWYKRNEEKVSPQWLIEQICEKSKGEAIVATDVGQHQMWAAQFYAFNKPHNWLTSGGLGTMGFGLPAAIGAQFGRPDDLVIAIVGDGGVQMTIQELAVIHEHSLPVKVFIVNNEALGMVRQWQEKFHGERYSSSLLTKNPDFLKIAEGYGIRSMLVEKEKDVPGVLEDVFAYDGPVVVDFRIDWKEKVFPMVAPGKGNNEMVGVKP